MDQKYWTVWFLVICFAGLVAGELEDNGMPVVLDVDDPTIVELIRKTHSQLSSVYPGEYHPKVRSIDEAIRHSFGGLVYQTRLNVGQSDCPKTVEFNEVSCALLEDHPDTRCSVIVWVRASPLDSEEKYQVDCEN